MFKNKLLRIGSVGIMSLGLLSISASAVVACGHKKPGLKYNWTTFLAAAQKASGAEIVAQYKQTIGWYDVPSNKLIKQKPEFITGHSITIQVYASSIWEVASFSISAPVDYKYSAINWKLSIKPKSVPTGSWEQFKYLARTINAATLLKTAKVAKNYASFKWEGKADSNVWKKTDIAEFDQFGGSGGTKADPINVMQGAPKIDEVNKTITAIISIEDKTKEGTCFSNPIKAVAKYNNGENYDLSKWSFSKVNQLQSHAKWLSIFAFELGKWNSLDFAPFTARSWTASNHISTSNDWFYSNWQFNPITSVIRSIHGWDTNTPTAMIYEFGYDVHYNIWLPATGSFHIKFLFTYYNVKNHNVGNAYNYVFSPDSSTLVYPS